MARPRHNAKAKDQAKKSLSLSRARTNPKPQAHMHAAHTHPPTGTTQHDMCARMVECNMKWCNSRVRSVLAKKHIKLIAVPHQNQQWQWRQEIPRPGQPRCQRAGVRG